ncbi:hypothetical protein SPV_2553 [Streptococcus pneumoniae]|nr:hypothetical protein SPV_2553 [Streptococcus pneumoniae]
MRGSVKLRPHLIWVMPAEGTILSLILHLFHVW